MSYRFQNDYYAPIQQKPTRVARNAMIGMLATFLVFAVLFFFLGDVEQSVVPETISGPNYTQVNQEYQQRLTNYGWVDRNAGKVHIPIDRAIDLLAQRGLPTRPAQ
jgi:hypothetical protein